TFSKDAIYQTSAINLAEIFHFDGNNENVMKAIVSVTGGRQFEVISFDETAALFHNQQFGTMLGNSVINDLKAEVNYKQGNGFANIKDRIRKDILIASTSKQYNSDIILTNDSGFFELCKRLDVFCYCFSENESDFVTSNDGEKIYNWTY
ncbi:MAG: type II toxin-antitoxin system VapC family toxin, partial [Mucilaginibacter sp.]